MVPIPAPLLAMAAIWLLLSPAQAAASCGPDAFEGTDYTVCAADPVDPGSDVRIFWRGADGEPYRTFAALADNLAAHGLTLVFAMNGGMFAEDYSPIGLHVENGEQMARPNTADARASERPVPNFYKKPNGIFFMAGDHAGVIETTRYLKEKTAADFATQSGPLLVIDGKIHPAFIVNSNDRKRRNGVGVCSDGMIRFAISEDAVNFHDFARFFRDHLGCDNALFLDGGWAPGLYAPEMMRNDWPGHGGYGPIVGVVRPSSN